ncbi:MAG: HAD-IIA family hydrolase [bacterium]
MEDLRRVRCFLLDMDGTFYLGDKILPGSLEFVERLRRQGKDFLFLTNNSSRDSRFYADKITRMGFPIPPEKVFTSGEATAIFLNKLRPGARIFLLGTPSLEDEFESWGFRLVREDPEFVVLGFDMTLTYEKLKLACDFIRRGTQFIATHPDINCPTEEGFIPDCGAMIAAIRASTGVEPKVIGKPNREIIESVLSRVKLPREELAIVGDRLYTDIETGLRAGIISILVLSGETKVEDLSDSPTQPTYVFRSLKELGEAI